MNDLQEEINRIWDIAVFLQMVAAFSDELDFNEYKELMLDFHDIIVKSSRQEIEQKLPNYEHKFNRIFDTIRLKYPLKRDYRDIAKDWNNKFKDNKEIFSNGIMIGWLEEQIDLSKFYQYDYAPYHFRIGLVNNKGRGEIEENFLLQDSFTSLIKAKKLLSDLDSFGKQQKEQHKSQGRINFDKETLDSLNALKYGICFYSRITIVSFFSFLESFVNSIGFDFYYRNKDNLNISDSELLRGKRKGRYINLKYKIERFQKIIRSDKSAKIVLSDEKQIKEPFKSLFSDFEGLRNSSVHFAPDKSNIWLKPHDWFNKAKRISSLANEAALNIWKIIHETNKGPDYLGRLEYDRLYEIAEKRESKVEKITVE
jgi:hypothetical protein